MTPNLPKERHKKSTKKDQNGSMESVDNLAVRGSIIQTSSLCVTFTPLPSLHCTYLCCILFGNTINFQIFCTRYIIEASAYYDTPPLLRVLDTFPLLYELRNSLLDPMNP